MDNLYLGFATAVSTVNLLYCLVGVVLGTLVGVLPGLGPMAAVAMLLPMVYAVNDPVASIICLAGVYYGSQYGGSITTILLRLPGEVSSTVTVLDGYAMTRNGRGGAALTLAAVSSFIAGTVTAGVMFVLAKPLSQVAFLFGPAEYTSLMILGLLACVAVVQTNMLKGICMIALGGFLGMIGLDLSTGEPRFTGGSLYLMDGIPFVVMVIGLFGIAEILSNISSHNKMQVTEVTSLYPNREEVSQSMAPICRGTVIGTILGLLPGGGTVLSSFFSYALEKRVSKQPHMFGNGAVAGLVGPEAANNSAAQAGFLPTLVLGLPVTPLMALMVATLMINGIQVGPDVVTANPDLFWGLIASMWIGNLFLLILNIPMVGIWIKILQTPRWILYLCIAVISTVGTLSIHNSWVDVALMLVFGLLGWLARKWRFEVTPLALAFIVIPMLEEYALRTLALNNGQWSAFVSSPLSASFVACAVAVVLLRIYFSWQSTCDSSRPTCP